MGGECPPVGCLPVDGDKPVLLYDGDCGLCRRVVGWIRGRAGDRIIYLRNKTAVQKFPDLHPPTPLSTSVILLDANGSFHQGMGVLFKIFALWGTPFLWNLSRSSGVFRWGSERLYRILAVLRPFISKVLDVLLGPPPEDL